MVNRQLFYCCATDPPRCSAIMKWLQNTIQQCRFASTAVDGIPSVDFALVPLTSSGKEECRYIPITRRTLIRKIIEQRNLLTPKEKLLFEEFATCLDSAIYKSFRPELLYLKKKYDDLNPDRDLKWASRPNQKQRKENEFWLIQRLSILMEKAHFVRLSQEEVSKALTEHDQGGVRVSVDLKQYESLVFWYLGRTKPPQPRIRVFKRWKNTVVKRVIGRSAREKPDFYQRVVVAMKMKRDKYFYLKAFKDVPVDSLEQLLPKGKILMSKWDKYLLWSSLGIGGVSLLWRGHVVVGSGTFFNYWMVFTGITAILVYRAISHYFNKRNSYLLTISKMLYYKNIANNRALLTLLVDRAEDETFKEALLVYTVMLTNRPTFYVPGDMSGHLTEADEAEPMQTGIPVQHLPQPSPISQDEIDREVTSWIHSLSFRDDIRFESASALKLLCSIGCVKATPSSTVVETTSTRYQVLPINDALNHLPKTETFLEKTDEFQVEDIAEEKTEENTAKDEKPKKVFAEVQSRAFASVKNMFHFKEGEPDLLSGWEKKNVGLFSFAREKLQHIHDKYISRRKKEE